MAGRTPGLSKCGRFRYVPSARLGSGAEADVYRGVRAGSNEPIAFKLMHRGKRGPLPELAVLTALPPHASIVPAPTPAVCASTGRLALVYPLFFSDLHTLVKDEPLQEATAAGMMRQLLAALAHIARAGLAHNDVKLENILVSAESGSGEGKRLTIALADFGLASAPRITGGVCPGTPGYFAPEVTAVRQGTIGSYDGSRADVWSAAVCGVMALTTGGVSVDDAAAVSFDASFLSPLARDFFASALVPDPAKRPSASELLEHPWLQPVPPSPLSLSRISMRVSASVAEAGDAAAAGGTGYSPIVPGAAALALTPTPALD